LLAPGNNGSILRVTNSTPTSLQWHGRIDPVTSITVLGQNTGVNVTGTQITAFGDNALSGATNSDNNTAIGSGANQNGNASDNTSIGSLAFNQGGGASNVAVGSGCMRNATIASVANVAVGFEAMINPDISGLVAIGARALQNVTTGTANVAIGTGALQDTVVGSANTAVGQLALTRTTGDDNTGVGAASLRDNISGTRNTALGSTTLLLNVTGSDNTVVGHQAGVNYPGSDSIFIGSGAGANVTDSSANPLIVLGSNPLTASPTVGTYISGISGAIALSGSLPVSIDALGRLGTNVSTIRSKRDVAPMERSEVASRLEQLNPVTFRYKTDPIDSHVRYGLIAEQVDDVFPEMVCRAVDPESGEDVIHGVQYEQFVSTLIAAFQKSQARAAKQDRAIGDLITQVASLRKQLDMVQRRQGKIND
jgi:hypothetical protein